MTIQGLGLYYTMRCTAACAHCGVWSSPDRRERMSLEQASRYVEEVAEHSRPKVVVLVGGEPLLHPEDVCALVRLIRSLGIVPQVSTAAFWASSDERARRTLADLAEAGLEHLAVSIDSYHAEFIDPRNVGRAMRIAREFGLIRKLQIIRSAQDEEGLPILDAAGVDPAEVIDHRVFKAHRWDPSFDARKWIVVNQHSVVPFGRAAFLKGHVVTHALDQLEESPCLMANRFPIVYPNGDLYSCCCTAGFYKEYRVGNLEQESLAQLQERMAADPVFEAIYRVGPVALAKSVRENGGDLGEEFASPCHACRRVLARTDRDTLENESRKLVLMDALFTDPQARRRFEELV
jgi:hypothetical protein